jgi:hypothetical protein
LYEKERGVQRRLTTIERTRDDFTKLDLEEQIKKYVAELQSEMVELIHANPQTPEDRHQVFVLKKRVVDTVLKEARVDQNRQIHMKFRSDFTTRTNCINRSMSHSEIGVSRTVKSEHAAH